MTIKQVFDLINEEYGLRGLFISELAGKLRISRKHANMLTIKAGYRRTKKVENVTLEEFSSNETVKYIIKKALSTRLNT